MVADVEKKIIFPQRSIKAEENETKERYDDAYAHNLNKHLHLYWNGLFIYIRIMCGRLKALQTESWFDLFFV